MKERVREVFVGIDVAKASHAVAIAEDGRSGEVRSFGTIAATPEAVRRLVTKLALNYEHRRLKASPPPMSASTS